MVMILPYSYILTYLHTAGRKGKTIPRTNFCSSEDKLLPPPLCSGPINLPPGNYLIFPEYGIR